VKYKEEEKMGGELEGGWMCGMEDEIPSVATEEERSLEGES
jgi:hypothetical protein